MTSAAEQLALADELSTAKPAEAIALYRAVSLGGSPAGEGELKTKEAAVCALAALLAKQGDAASLRTLLAELRPLFAVIPKAKTAKLVRVVIDAVATVPHTEALQARALLAGPRRRSPV
jgi:26S proteasome regulatory subunit N6